MAPFKNPPFLLQPSFCKLRSLTFYLHYYVFRIYNKNLLYNFLQPHTQVSSVHFFIIIKGSILYKIFVL